MVDGEAEQLKCDGEGSDSWPQYTRKYKLMIVHFSDLCLVIIFPLTQTVAMLNLLRIISKILTFVTVLVHYALFLQM
jgi:hypothetical protein